MMTSSSTRQSNLMRRSQASCNGWEQSGISCRPTSFTTLISGSGRKPFPMRSHGHYRACVRKRALGTSTLRLRETSTPIRLPNGGKTSTRRCFPVDTSKSLFSSKGIEVADSHGRDYQHRIEQDARALASGDEAHWHVLSSRADILWHAAAAIAAAAEGKGGVRKNLLLATRARFAQSWPVFRVPRQRSHREDIRRAHLLKVESVRLPERQFILSTL